MAMDARRQKRLGPAPIASFEKSFEDNATTNVQQQQQQQQQQQHQQQEQTLPASGMMMEQTLRKQTTMSGTGTGTGTVTGNGSGGVVGSVVGDEAPSISGGTGPSGSSSSSSASASSTTCSATTVAKQRPPPLKTATTTVTTTLVSSNEGGQPLPPTAQGYGSGGGANSYRGTATLTTPSTPRIELSRASSSSHHEEDSRESSPENVFDQETIGLGFREEGALELRSSTEELYFMDPEQKKEEQERIQQQQQQQQQAKRSSPHIFKFDDHQSYLQQHQRKDSASSEVAALLCISGRTSRISSVGSQGSAVSRLSAVSGVSRSPSPHRMLLETSFCGPKPVEHGAGVAGAGGASNASTAPSSNQSLGEVSAVEQMLLSRKHDPTQVVLAEGIQVQPSTSSSTTRRSKPSTLAAQHHNGESKTAKASASNSLSSSNVMGGQRRSTKSPGQMVIGKTPSGTEYIRINLRPDHMYSDKGIAANERVVEAPNQLTPVYSKSSSATTTTVGASQPKPPPASLSLHGGGIDEHRLTPTASPKPSRHALRLGSRSPSPAPASVSRKSSFSSLFRLGKDSPDSPRESSRSRSKSKERPSTATSMGMGSQNVTPSKQKSVLAIFKPGKRGSSSSKSSSPIETCEPPPPPPPAPAPSGASGGRSRTPAGSRPNSRLRYYDEPVEGYIHIPLHTPPEDREALTLLQGIQKLAAPSPPPQSHKGASTTGGVAPITASQLAAAAAALRPVNQRKPPQRSDLDAIQSLPSQEEVEKERGTWSLEVQRHSSQDSQETLQSVSSVVSARAANLAAHLPSSSTSTMVRENGVASEMQRLPSVDSNQSACEPRLVQTVATVTSAPVEDAAAKERRRLLFATRLGSGSQEQLFSTQFSISKTESQSSQLSEQVLESTNSTASECTNDGLQRQGTVIRRTVDAAQPPPPPPPPRGGGVSSSEEEHVSATPTPTTPSAAAIPNVVMRSKHKSRPTSEDEAPAVPQLSDARHSRYLENFDVRKKYHENVAAVEKPQEKMIGTATIPRKPKRQSISTESKQATTPTTSMPTPAATKPPTPTAVVTSPIQISKSPVQSPKPCLDYEMSQPEIVTATTTTTTTAIATSPSGDQQHSHSTDEHEPIESSESERDSDMAGGSSSVATAVQVGADGKRHHFPRNVCVIEEHESTGLVSQESFDDELPYIPTTLPEERAQGVPLIPMKERANMELKTCPVDRPRSTTPLNPSHLEEYCTAGIMTPQEAPHGCHEFDSSSSVPMRGEKLRISLPRKEAASVKDKELKNSKSPRRISNANGKSWFEFAEEGLRATNLERKDSSKQLLPAAAAANTAPVSSTSSNLEEPKPKASTQRKLSGHWIDFENIPEKRKPAKRITTLPKETIATSTAATTSSSSACAGGGHRSGNHHHHHQHHHHSHHQTSSRQPPDVTGSSPSDKLHYNYVKPEDCQCECHEAERGESSTATGGGGAGDSSTGTGTGTGTGSESLASVDLLQQGEDMLPLLEPEISVENRTYADAELSMTSQRQSVNKTSGSRLDEFPRREAAPSSSRHRKFPDRK
ncbi:platelet binding protein GspB isoform X2 [Drosophila tropicalis]|uniref:platelet binding protein GspB isoform X2 n=1 Tax=Drosophila tropicalis TaxID=46794 RepID=UPI0035AC2163